ncbi:hypothetical protein BDR26DRAFT_880498, partial [Obelidium mucronatum]
GLIDTDNAAPIAFYPHNHLQNVLLQSPRSPFINPSFLPPSTITPTTNPTASPRFTGGNANNGGGGGTRSSNQSARSSPFAFTSTPLNNNTSSIPFLALPMSEIELPPPQQQLQLQQQKGRKHSTAPLISSPFSQPIPNNNSTTTQRGISSPFMNPRLLSSPKLNGRIIPQSPYLNGSNDFSSTGGPDGGMVTVAGASANAEDMLVSLAFNNRLRK